MDRRSFLHASVAAAVAASLPGAAAAATTAATPPPFPPIDARSVWLVGDGAPPDPAGFASQLSALIPAHGKVRDSYLADGAVGELEKAFAALLGKEDCAFLATGTLANNVALRVLCGDHHRAIVQHESHLYRDESDSAQRLSGINLVPLAPGRAVPTLDELTAAFDEAENGPYPLKIGALSIESPVRRADGELVPLAAMTDIAKLARAHGARLHLDGARLLLAPPAFDIKPYAALFDTVYVSLYKYLGAPFGAVLAGTKADIAQARDWRHLYGGTIYQGWAPALIAAESLKTFPERMAQAHGQAAALMSALKAGGKVVPQVGPNDSNIHWLEMPENLAAEAFDHCRVAGIRFGRWDKGRVVFYVNETISRRPVDEIARLILG